MADELTQIINDSFASDLQLYSIIFPKGEAIARKILGTLSYLLNKKIDNRELLEVYSNFVLSIRMKNEYAAVSKELILVSGNKLNIKDVCNIISVHLYFERYDDFNPIDGNNSKKLEELLILVKNKINLSAKDSQFEISSENRILEKNKRIDILRKIMVFLFLLGFIFIFIFSKSDFLLKEETPPLNGKSFLYNSDNGVCPFKVNASETEYSVVKIEEFSTHIEKSIFFIRPGGSKTIMLNQGYYTIKIASGNTWYGYDDLFGSKTALSVSSERIELKKLFDGCQGIEITLEKIEDGNFKTKGLSKDDF